MFLISVVLFQISPSEESLLDWQQPYKRPGDSVKIAPGKQQRGKYFQFTHEILSANDQGAFKFLQNIIVIFSIYICDLTYNNMRFVAIILAIPHFKIKHMAISGTQENQRIMVLSHHLWNRH